MNSLKSDIEILTYTFLIWENAERYFLSTIFNDSC